MAADRTVLDERPVTTRGRNARGPGRHPKIQTVTVGRKVSIAITVLAGVLAFVPVALTLLMAFTAGLLSTSPRFTLDVMRRVWIEDPPLAALRNTVLFALGTTVVALAFGAAIALIATRTDYRFKRSLFGLMGSSVLVPSYITAIAWILLLSPRIGLINQIIRKWTGGTEGPISVYNLVGLSFIEGLVLTPVAFFLLLAPLASMDLSLEEAALASGVRRLRVFGDITLRLVRPALGGAAIYIFILTVGVFETPLVLGGPANLHFLSTDMYYAINVTTSSLVPDYNSAAALGMSLLLMGVIAVVIQRRGLGLAESYQVVSGKSYRTGNVPLGRLRWAAHAIIGTFVLFRIVLPLLALIWVSVSPFIQAPSAEALRRVSFANYLDLGEYVTGGIVLNTALLLLIAPLGSLVIGFACAWVITRTRFRFRGLTDQFAFAPHAVPRILGGIAFVFLFLSLARFFPLYGSIWAVVIVMTLALVPIATRTLVGSLSQIHREIEEAGLASGVRASGVFRFVLVPLSRSALVSGFLWLAVLAYREITTPLVVGSSESTVLSVQVFQLWNQGDSTHSSALGVLFVLGSLLLLAAASGLVRRGRTAEGGRAGPKAAGPKAAGPKADGPKADGPKEQDKLVAGAAPQPVRAADG